MQWLFDIIEEKMEAAGFIKNSYVDRGDHDVSDWVLSDFIVDGAEHDIDLSEHIPAKAKAANLHVVASTTVITDTFYLRPASHPATFGACTMRPQVASHTYCVRRAFGHDADGIYTYRFTGTGWLALKINVKGWWL